MAAALAGSGYAPLSEILLRIKGTDGDLNRSFFAESVDPDQHTSPTAAPSFGLGRFQRLILCRRIYTQISSTMLITPRRPSKNS